MKWILALFVSTNLSTQEAQLKYGNFGPVLDMIAESIKVRERNAQLNIAIKNTPIKKVKK